MNAKKSTRASALAQHGADTKSKRVVRRKDPRQFAGVSCRLDAATEVRLDALAVRLGGEGGKLTRAHVAREAMLRGLDVLESECAKGVDRG